MLKTLLAIAVIAGFFQATHAQEPKSGNGDQPSGVHWPSFRGPNSSGVAEGFELPVKWNGETGENIKWKTPIKGLGHSSPVIWDQKMFVTSAISGAGDHSVKVGVYGDGDAVQDSSEHQWVLYCLDKTTGKILWERSPYEGVPQIKRHLKSSHANSTPATNGEFVVAFFGSEGLYCFDMDGNPVWEKNLGTLDAGAFDAPDYQWGFGSSPIIYEDRVIVQCDVQGKDFLAAFNIADGSEVWFTERDEVPTWSTPVIYRSGKRVQVVVNGFHQIGGYDVETGKSLWQMKGGGDIPVASPIVGGGLVYITNSHGGKSPVYAISGNPGRGQTFELVWANQTDGAYLQTPIAYGEYLYVSKYGKLRCFNASTGKLLYQTRLKEGGRVGFTPSPVASNGKVYFTSEEGEVLVLEVGPEFKIVAENKLGEICMATPAISEGVIFFRTKDHLMAVGK